jgi:hypothetical protein
MKKKFKKTKIKIFLHDGGVHTVPPKQWDDYDYCDGLFVVKRKGAWIGIYNMKSVDYILIG